MIRAVCLNPVIDKMYFVDDFTAGKLFRDVQTFEFVGGKGINIAKALSKFEATQCCYAILAGARGKKIEQTLKSLKIDCKFIEIDGETRTTTNIIDKKNSTETELLESGSLVSEEKERQVLELLRNDILENDIVICAGKGGTGMSKDIYKRIAKICESKKANCVLDASSFWLLNAFDAKYLMIKPNVREIKEFFNIDHKISERELIEYARKFLDKGAENIIISRGGDGCIFINSDKILKVKIPKVDVASTIGSGDSSVAGFCFGVEKKLSIEDCLKYSMAF
ncbi:MAG: 1-phosphofructokinase family hexose kinase, partial [Clostridia bacterium]